jgi:hypothetical protein
VLGTVEHDARFRQQGFAGLGQLDTARLAPEQLDLELGLEGTDLLAERRLLDAEPRCRASHMAFLSDGYKIAEMAQFHFPYTEHITLAITIYWTEAKAPAYFDPGMRRAAMADEAKLLTVQFLRWVAERPRNYAELPRPGAVPARSIAPGKTRSQTIWSSAAPTGLCG